MTQAERLYMERMTAEEEQKYKTEQNYKNLYTDKRGKEKELHIVNKW